MATGIAVYTSNRLEDLLEALATRLAEAPLAPLQTETIVVPGQGLARWVQLRLAERHGIAAGLSLPFPGAFLQELCRSAGLGPDLFGRDVLLFRLWRLLGDETLQRDLGPAADYCRDDADGRKRFQLCERLAACFDDYQLYRDDLLLRAARGDDLQDLGPHGPWQARLWRALLRDAGLAAGPAAPGPKRGKRAADATPLLFAELGAKGPDAAPQPAHRLQQLRELLADGARARTLLPPRLSVFGAGTLGPAFLDLLLRIAGVVPVALYVPLPTPEFVGDLRPGDAGGNALLARLGKEAREFQDLLIDLEERAGAIGWHREEVGHRSDRDRATVPATLLACVQQDIAAVTDRGAPGGEPRFPLRADDDSLRVHDCHSEQRELEVVRDQILDAFARDPRLEPHEVLVLVPDIDRYAPYAHAVFGPVSDHLPFHVADRSPASELPLCASMLAVLQLAQDRLHVFDVLHLLEEPAVQRRFGLFAGDLPMLRDRCERAGIRWGLDGAWRERQFHVPPFDENAWLPGLDRLLLGVATGPQDDLIAGMLPVADATDGRKDLLARFLAFAGTLFARLEPLQRCHALPLWADHLDALLGALYAPVSADDEAALAHLQRATAALRTLGQQAQVREPVSPTVLHDWLRSSLQQGTGARGFLAGAVTVAAMLPMRTVPCKHLFLCGLDDQSFPRRDQPAAFDLINAARRPGDRSLRLDDRQMFLDSLLAARQRLHLTFLGHSQKDDSECAPSVVLAELLDHVDRTCTVQRGAARDAVLVRHPLQPWSLRYRTGDDERLFTYARDDLQRIAQARGDEPPWFQREVEPPEELRRKDLPFELLAEFWRHPCRFFLKQAMRVRIRRDDDPDADTEPFAVDNLDRWRLQEGAVRAALRGEPPPADPLARARATGWLPVGGQGAAAWTAVDDETQAFLHELRAQGDLARVPLRVELADATLHGEVAGVGAREMVLARIARFKPKDHLRGWLTHVFAAVARFQGADLPDHTRLIAKTSSVVLLPLPEAVAREQLDWLVAGFRAGVHAPLPFFETASHTYGQALHKGEDPSDALRRARRDWLPKAADVFPRGDSEDEAAALCMRGREALLLPGFAEWAERIWTTAHGYTEKVG